MIVSAGVIWLIIAAILILIELGIGAFYFLWLAAAAGLTAGVAFIFPHNLWIQLLSMALISVTLILFTPKLTKRMQNKSPGFKDDNSSLIGLEAFVISEISPSNVGVVRIKGRSDWSAITHSEVTLIEGTVVVITDKNNLIVTVEPIIKN